MRITNLNQTPNLHVGEQVARVGKRYKPEVTLPMTELDLKSRTANCPVQCFSHYMTWTLVIEKTEITCMYFVAGENLEVCN